MYLFVPLTEDERAAIKARKLTIRIGEKGVDRPAYDQMSDCQRHWPDYIPTLVFISWVKP